ncbi:Filament-like plant protein 4 [Quillaja saponaria]|uniref:Filament-like plant protein 4 n=1 Tax=Quillaja saponaria TaxID=32244 RepID=A0AAD7M173_QUISA|nr:Filament-like plant protein 4 [Quillaja saponaria]
MDRRSWPWKKKSSDKAAAEKAAALLDAAGASNQANQDNYKKPNYVQISVESYSHLTGLEDQVKTYEEQVQTQEDQIKELNEKLSEANSEMTTKENLVKQHAKVAEEAVSGWEKAEAEALALKNHLESVTLSKLTAEDPRHTFRRSAAENAAITRSLQERSNMLIKLSEEKSQAEAEIELLKNNIESCEREINSLKYELHIVSKELEIRNEEKNMSIRSAEAANKQHVDGVKKIAKLEAECQRLRGLVRKKLPGPAALAQMKLEVESLGRDYGEIRFKRSPVKPSSPKQSPVTDFSLDNAQKFQKENEFLTERLLAIEEETKMLKEALAKRNSELQASRSMCAKTLSKLQTLESQFQTSDQHKGSPKSIIQITHEGTYSQKASNPPSLTSMSEYGNDDEGSCAESWATPLASELSQFRKEKNIEKPSRAESGNNLELMDDFLEMEKLACQANKSNGDISVSVCSNNISEVAKELTAPPSESEGHQLSLIKLRSRISLVLESMCEDADMGKTLEDVKRILEDVHITLNHQSVSCIPQDVHSSDATCDRQANPEDAGLTAEKEITSPQPITETVHIITPDVEAAISHIHDFVQFLGKEAMVVHGVSLDGAGLREKIGEFSVTFNRVIYTNASLVQFVLDLSHVLAHASKFRFNVLGYKGTDGENGSPDCIDKVALPENTLVQEDSSGERYQSGCSQIPIPCSDPEVPDDGNLVLGYEPNTTMCKYSVKELEELKLEKDTTAMELARCTENLEVTKSQLQEMEQLLAEVKSQLASAQRSNSLSETQLKCMAESYRSLETRSEELETELNLLRAKTEMLEHELQDEKRGHQDALNKCTELGEKLQRHESIEADNDNKTKQERDLAAAADKLAECQETIFLLGKQLNSLRPQTELMGSPCSERSQKGEGFAEDEPTTTSDINLRDADQAQMDRAASASMQRPGSESPLDLYSSPCSPTEIGSNRSAKSPIRHPIHRPTKSSSSSASTATPEKNARAFSRFFSSKGKNGH